MIPALVATALALPPLMPVESIQRGQVGQCLTVFEGDEVEPFEFVVKGVMENFLGPKKHLVLIRLKGEKPEFTGVVAGMSGSPCSIDGKLVGALAYAFATFAKEPIAGITPMGDMLEVMKQPSEVRPWRLPGDAEALRGAPVTRDTSDESWKALREGRALAQAQPSRDGLAPIATPLAMSGFHPLVRDHFTPWLESQGFVPVSGGSGGNLTQGSVASVKPGSAVAAVLVKGDVSIAATGTVTSVEGNEVLAFGHPFLGTGLLSVPMASATILNTMVSTQRSFKMSQPTAIVGEVTQDRLTAIGGQLGAAPAMIPVRGVMRSAAGEHPFSFDVARDASLSPRFTAMGIANALYGGVDQSGRGTLRLVAEVQADGLPPVKIRTVHASQRDPNLQLYAAIDVARTVATLWDTPFGPPPGLSVKLDATLEPQPIVEWIEAMHIDRAVARPGEQIQVVVRIRQEDGPSRQETFGITVPRSWANEEIELIACGADLAQQITEDLAGDPRPENLAQVAEWLNNVRLDGHLYLLGVRPSTGMRSEVTTHPFLPPSAVTLLSGDVGKQRRLRGLAWDERRPQPGVLMGGTKATVRVRSL